MKPVTSAKDKRRRRSDARELRTSLAFYFGLVLLAGQFVARVALGVETDPLMLAGTFAIVLGVLFGPTFVIDFFRALRGSKDERGGDDA